MLVRSEIIVDLHDARQCVDQRLVVGAGSSEQLVGGVCAVLVGKVFASRGVGGDEVVQDARGQIRCRASQKVERLLEAVTVRCEVVAQDELGPRIGVQDGGDPGSVNRQAVEQ